MKKLLLVLLVLAGHVGLAQTAFMEYQFTVDKGGGEAVESLFDAYFGEATFKSGGVNLESMSIGNEVSTHRVVFYGDPANWGRNDGDLSSDKWGLFLQKINNHIEDWTHSSSGDVISWEGGDDEKYPYFQLYEFKAADEKAFGAAHDKIVSKLSPVIGERAVGFGTYEIGGYGGATHWVIISAENWKDLMMLKRAMAKMDKAWKKYYEDRGEVVHIRNYTLRMEKTY